MILTVKDRVPDLLKAVRDLTKTRVLVGIPDANAGRNDGPVSNAVIGYIQEFGSPAQNIPERPFLVPGVQSVEEKTVERLKKAGQAALSGDTAAVEQAQHAIGLEAQSAVRAKIQGGPFAPLSERTLARRRARGRTGEKPLVDTGQLRNSVTYVIRPKGG